MVDFVSSSPDPWVVLTGEPPQATEGPALLAPAEVSYQCFEGSYRVSCCTSQSRSVLSGHNVWLVEKEGGRQIDDALHRLDST
jgi:hypothetical protein